MPVKIRIGGVRKDGPPLDPAYLARLAAKLALACRLSPELAQKRVMALAVSAQPREVNGGFQDRNR
jgi:hypothetical protein